MNMFYNLTGDFEKAIPVIDALKNISQARNVRPIVRIWVKRAESIHYRCTVQHEKCLEAVSDGLELSRSTGIHVIDHFLLTQGISSALNRRDIKSAESWLGKEALSYPVLGSWHRGLYHLQRTRIALLRGDFTQARFHADLSLTSSVEAGSPYTLGFAHIVNSLVKHGLRNDKEAKEHLGQVFDIAQEIGGKIYEFSALLLEALFDFDQGKEESGWTSLQKALTLGRERGYFYPYVDLPDGMPRLCIKALEAGVEVEYVQELIRRCHIEPDLPPWHLENWPWSLKVFTLGRFALIREGNPIRFSRKVQQKPLSMLKALIALGGKDVGEEQIIDALWPEAEGDAAHQLFETTLHRLRQLISFPEAVQRRDGRLTLNQNHCWVDAWAFERLIGQTLDAQWEKSGGPSADDTVLRTQKAIDFYGGAFLPGDAQEFWTNSLRERLRSKFLRVVEKLGRHWQESGQYEKAVECFQRGLEADDILEEFYQALMLLYQGVNRRTEALSVYTRCKKALFASLGVEPSPKTEAIRKSILLRKNP